MPRDRLRRRIASAAALIGFFWITPARAQGGGDPGEIAFQKCYACHSVNPAETNLPGPNLAGAIGRRAAALKDFDYSPAMQAAGREGLIWDRATLDRFLSDPEAMLPGTSMAFPGLKAQSERQAVMRYLEMHR